MMNKKTNRLFAFLTVFALMFSLFSPMTLKAQERQLTKQVEIKKMPKRIALVIGNGNYAVARKLANPVNDAGDMTKALTEVGFEVISGTNLNLKQMTDKVREFGDSLKANGGVGLFYYAGHGVQVNNKNYLIPVEADISREDEIDFAALNFDIVLRKMATANNGLNIVILDACRDNPFARSWSRSTDDGGLAQVTAPTGTFIAYATSPDKTASDGDGRNGLYTTQLLKIIRQPNLKIEEAFKQVTIAVDRASGGNQIPWTSSSLRGEFYFKPSETVAPVKDKPTDEPTITAKTKAEQEKEAWDLVKNSASASDFRYYLEEFPDGANAARAKIRLEELVWQSVRGADTAKIQAYLKEFPNGANAAAARIRLRQLENGSPSVSAGGTTTPTNNNSTNRMAGAISKSTLPNGVEMSFAYIPAGDFMMGGTESDEKPVHKVSISQGFFMGRTEVTQAQWQAVMGNNPSNFKGDNLPVEQVSWDDAQSFIAKLNAQNDGYKYRLPTEAEWEYAARSGTTGDYAGNLDAMAWYSANAGSKTHEVGTKQANAWGLFDMHGNVWEWCQDWYGESYYANSPSVNPTGATSGSVRVYRGGGWFDDAVDLRSAHRGGATPSSRGYNLGFRFVRN